MTLKIFTCIMHVDVACTVCKLNNLDSLIAGRLHKENLGSWKK